MNQKSGQSSEKLGKKLKRRAKSNGKVDTNDCIVEEIPVLTAQNVKVRRSTNEEVIVYRNSRLYDIGNSVVLNDKDPKIKYQKALIVGYEWGGDQHRLCGREIWCYWVQELGAAKGADTSLVPEDNIVGLLKL